MDPLFEINGIKAESCIPEEAVSKAKTLKKSGNCILGYRHKNGDGYLLFWNDKEDLTLSSSKLEVTIKALAELNFIITSGRPFHKDCLKIKIDKQPFLFKQNKKSKKNSISLTEIFQAKTYQILGGEF